MINIKTLPINELLKDRAESLLVTNHCLMALSAGVTTYCGGSVQECLEVNREIVRVIEAELARRDSAPRRPRVTVMRNERTR